MSEFRPLPLLRNPHVQTVVGSLLPEPAPTFPVRTRLLRLPDGDALLLHESAPSRWRPGHPAALLLHGLGGSSASPYVVRLNRLLHARGWRVARLDLRGAGAGIRHARRTYNAASSGDVRAALAELHRAAPASPLVLVGFSLGGNIALKLAGEAAAGPVPGLAAVAAVSPPIDLEACSRLLQQPANRFYDYYFGQRLARLVARHRRLFPDLPPVRFPDRVTLRQIDDLYTAPCGGFADTAEYYARASSLPLLPKIAVPTLILTARDDPFIAAEPIASLPRLATVEVRVVPHGGHLGFIGLEGLDSVRWAERQVADWVCRAVGGNRPA